jgi:DNA-binding transcriptional MerR regulator
MGEAAVMVAVAEVSADIVHGVVEQSSEIETAPAKKRRVKRTESDDDADAVSKTASENLPSDWQGSKQYYSIGEVADLFKVKTSHIRFWTNEFKLKVRTTRKGDRLYTPDQIKELRAIHHLVKERGFTLTGAKARLKNQNKIDVETVDLKQSLLQLRNKLVVIRNQL